jgi:hypothetical protein
MSLIAPFIAEVLNQSATGIAREHAYRPALAKLLQSLDPDIKPVNDAARSIGGAPDFTLLKDDIAIGHLEAKDINLGLRKMNPQNAEQQKRYLEFYDNLIYTNCLDWDFYRKGILIASVTVGDDSLGITPRPDKYAELENLLRDFVTQRPQTITTPRDLAERMAQKARMFKDALANTLADDPTYTSVIGGHYRAFQNQLIHDISPTDFADIYAETIAYGMFAARLHDKTPDTFSRAEAMDLLPKSNPFLRELFKLISQQDLDDRIKWAVDDLASVFRAANITQIMAGFGKLTAQNDPFLHFYETFLGAYDPKKKKAKGVWYTPEPVVNFIVRAVDDVLRDEFGLKDGLADTSKVTVDWDTGQTEKAKAVTIKKEVHRVQILDPATGTGTFLAEVIKHIAPRIKAVGSAAWPTYIEQNLIPRLHGFELLMAAYAMCHLKLDMILRDLGYVPTASPPRMGVYLTNSLEQGDADVRDLFMAKWLSDEARAASSIKRQTPIMCVIGNPPYLGEGGASTGWMGSLMEDYKKEPGGAEKLRERNPKWINDLYVKFLRLSSHLIEKNGEGVLGFITNHGYLDNPTFRGMRWHLLNTFDKIWVLDLHGNAKKKEVAPDGGADKNVFDIMQGVSIIIAVKKKGKGPKALAQVMQGDLWGARAAKYAALQTGTLAVGLFSPLETPAPQYPLVRRNFDAQAVYETGFAINAFMPANSVGIVTARDSLTIDMDKETLWARVRDFANLPPEEARSKYDLGEDVQDWAVARAQKDVQDHLDHARIVPIAYRPFDTRQTFYTGTSRGFICRPRDEVMRNMLSENMGLGFTRTVEGSRAFADVLVFDRPITHHSLSIKEVNALFPLYLYPSEQDLDQSRRVNFDPALFKALQDKAAHPVHGTPDEVAVFDYIYGVLHCPAYRATYAEFLKIDFPRIPWPASPDAFWDISAKGTQLRALHLMQPAAIGGTPYPFEGAGNSIVDKPRFEGGRVWINDTQSFANAPAVAWEFYIGGYQPAQKWLKDRRGRALSFEDIRHYQSVLKILSETARIMGTIEMAF